MSALHRKLLLIFLKVGDLVLATLAYGLSTFLLVNFGTGSTFSNFLSMRIKLANFLVFGVVLLSWHLIYSLCHLYESKRLYTASEVMLEAQKATGLATGCLLVIATAFKIRMVTFPFVLLFGAINSLALLSSRALLRGFLSGLRKRGRNLRHIVIIGTNARAVEFARRLRAKPEWGYRCLGFVDEQWNGLSDFNRSGETLAGTFERFAEFLRSNVVDEVAIYLPLRSHHAQASAAASLCAQHGITVRYDSDVFGISKKGPAIEEFDADPYFVHSSENRHGWPFVLKRVFDICGSFVLLLLLLPVLLIVACLIKLTSPGTVFFFQERIGTNKRRFHMWKFRTMVVGAERLLPQLTTKNEASGPVFKIKDDPRITPVGRFLRRSSIDELPQLFNVLKGDMSLVGPRPLPVRDFDGFNEDWQRRRFSVRPGITCLWQVQGRSSIGFEQWMELDLKYLDEWSLWLDLKILAMTIPAVVRGSGAA